MNMGVIPQLTAGFHDDEKEVHALLKQLRNDLLDIELCVKSGALNDVIKENEQRAAELSQLRRTIKLGLMHAYGTLNKIEKELSNDGSNVHT